MSNNLDTAVRPVGPRRFVVVADKYGHTAQVVDISVQPGRLIAECPRDRSSDDDDAGFVDAFLICHLLNCEHEMREQINAVAAPAKTSTPPAKPRRKRKGAP